MNKLEFIKEYKKCYKKNITYTEAKKDVEAFLDLIENNIMNVGNIKFTEIGAFSVLERKERVISNPKTRERMTIYPLTTVKFIPTKVKKEEK